MLSSLRLYFAAAGLILLPRLGGYSAPITDPVAPNPVAAASGGMKAAISALERDDPAASVLIATPLAASGDPDAQHLLGFLHDLGLGVSFDPKLGLEWQERAAGTGHYWASLYLGWKYRVGFGPDKPNPVKGDELQSVLFKHTPTARVIPAEWLLVNGSSFAPNYVRARRWLAAQAERGDAVAAATLAAYYLAGLGVRADVQQHLRWLAIAGERGHAASLERLSIYYDAGLGVAANPALALDFLQRAAAAGSSGAQYSLGRKLLAGRDLPADAVKAAEWLRKAAGQNHIAAINRLADLLRMGSPGVPVDYGEALRLSRQAAALGDPEAIADVAGMLRLGQGPAKDLSEAVRLYQSAAEKGYAYAAHMVGWMITYGEAGERAYTEARRWFEIAAKDNYAPAINEIGLQFSEGRGAAVDQAEAFVWFERAAREGNDWAQNRVGWMLLNGTGIEKDPEEAVSWFNLAAKQKNGPALINLGFCYERGTGTERNLPLAADCYRQAVVAGEKGALANLGSVALSSSGKEQIALFREVTPLLAEADSGFNAWARLIRGLVLMDAKNPLRDESSGVAALEILGSQEPSAVIALVRHYLKIGAWGRARQFMESVPEKRAAIINYYLGLVYLTGIGGPRNPEAGVAALRKGPRESMLPLAYCHYLGLGTPNSERSALSLVKQAAEFGITAAQEALKQPTEKEALEYLFSLEPRNVPKIPIALDDREPDSRPRMITTCAPAYPFLLSRLGVTGRAKVEFFIDENGTPSDLRVVESSAPDFGEAAMAAIRHSRFTPGKVNGRPVKVRTSQLLEFTLED